MVDVERARKVRLPVKVLDSELKAFETGDWSRYASKIHALVQTDFLTSDLAVFVYGMFKGWDADAGETEYRTFRRLLPLYYGMYTKYIQVQNGSLSCAQRPLKDIVERIGIGVALAVVARLLGLTQADFLPIPESNTIQTLDYLYALGPNFEVEIEAKGTHDAKSTADARADIRAKKSAQEHAQARDPMRKRRRILRIGVITDLALSDGRESRVELVDPPGDGSDEDLGVPRYLARLDYYRSRLLLLTPRGRSVTALANRLDTLRRLDVEHWSQIDGAPLVGPAGTPLTGAPLPGIEVELLGDGYTTGRVKLYPLEEVGGRGTLVRCYVHGLVDEVLIALLAPSKAEILALQVPEAPFVVRARGIDGAAVVLSSGVVGGVAMVAASRLRSTADDDRDAGPRRRRRGQA